MTLRNPTRRARLRRAGVRFLAAALITSIVGSSALADDDPPYTQLVDQVGEALQVSPAVIHAVIAAESSYDPNARSHAGALGLMQLIPEAGALEAYRYLYGRDAIPTDASLMRPEVNVWLGTAYLRILGERYFAWIENPDVRMRAILAAYNWGPGRVLERLLPGREEVGLQEFMRRLHAEAPDETQVYLRRVLTKAVGMITQILASR